MHLLTIFTSSFTLHRLQTSYVAVEPKKKKERSDSSIDTSHGPLPTPSESASPMAAAAAASKIDQSSQAVTMGSPSVSDHQNLPEGTLRRSRIVITVKRTEAYVKWLEDNPIQDIHSRDDNERI